MENRCIYLWFTLILPWYPQRTYECDEVADLRHVRCVGEVTPPGFQVRLPGCLTHCDVPNGLKTSTGTCDFEDVDECLLKVDDCSVNSYCVNTVGSYSCQCLSGYAIQDSVCLDVNECLSGLHNCSINEICINSEGFHSCECMSGFIWDDQECVDIDECYLSSYNCSLFSYCVNDIGSYTCECLPGYSKNGSEEDCKDIDECADHLHNCSTNSYCVNTNSSYSCLCLDGFYWNGSDCEDVDECGANLHNCGTGVTCTNTQGSYVCECDTDHSLVENQCVANPYRRDARCGSGFIAPNGDIAICNKDSDSYCCSHANWCGSTANHCRCSQCINYREL